MLFETCARPSALRLHAQYLLASSALVQSPHWTSVPNGCELHEPARHENSTAVWPSICAVRFGLLRACDGSSKRRGQPTHWSCIASVHDVATKRPQLALSPEARPPESLPQCSTVREARALHVRTFETFTPPTAAMSRRSTTSGLAPPIFVRSESVPSVLAMWQILPQLDNGTRAVRTKFSLCFADWSSCVFSSVAGNHSDIGGTLSRARQQARTLQKCATAVAQVHSSCP